MGLNIYDRTFGFEFEVADVEKSRVTLPSGYSWSKEETIVNSDGRIVKSSFPRGGELNTPPLLLRQSFRKEVRDVLTQIFEAGGRCTWCHGFAVHIYAGDLELEELKKKYEIPDDAVIFIYGGNLGKPQGISFLIDCLRYTRNNSKAYFIIIGSGSEFGKLKAFVDSEKPANVKLLNYMPKDEYQLISDQCDVGMMFLDHRFTIPNFPSRILNYLASGNPVLAATDANTDIGTIARDNGFGFCCESNDVKGFAKAFDDFINADREVMGEKGWNFLKNNWSVENGYNIIMKHFG